jgi:hypothetical protein
VSELREDIQALLVRSWERRYSVKASEIMAVVAPIVSARDAAVEQLERLHSWGGLLELLDEHWPADIFPVPETIEAAKSQERRDIGPVVLSLIRWVDRLSVDLAAARQQLDQVRAAFQRWSGGPDYEFEQTMRALLDAPARRTGHDESGQ